MEVKPHMIVKTVSSSTAVVIEAEWCAVKSHTDEARVLLHNFVDSLEERNNPTSSPARASEVRSPGEATAATPTTTFSTPSQKQTLGGFAKFGLNVKKQIKRVPSYFISTPKNIPEVEQLFKEATKQPKFWEDAAKSPS